MKRIAVLGAGGHTRSLLNLLDAGKYRIEGIYDRNFQENCREAIGPYPLQGGPDDISGAEIVISSGNPMVREEFYRRYSERILGDNLFHPLAVVEKNVSLGRCNQLFAGSYVNSFTRVGDNNVINSGALVEHECVIGSHNHLAVGACIAGRVTIGDLCLIGAGAVLVDTIAVCSKAIIGAGAVVVDDIREPGTYVGCPARRIK